MKHLDLLEQELKLMLENIGRVREYQRDSVNQVYKPYNSLVVGELKHRAIALKQRLTLTCKMETRSLWPRE